MAAKTMPTSFLPAERAPQRVILLQHALVAAAPHVQAMLDAMPAMVVVLNRERQVVFANKAFAKVAGGDSAKILGQRTGEVLRCVRSQETPGGCGTTEFCRECGAANAIRSAQEGKADVRECRVRTSPPADAFDLRVYTTPFLVGGESFTLFAVLDISSENRRKALERIFFHDVLNAAGSVAGLAGLLPEASPQEVVLFSRRINHGMWRVIGEIQAQRELVLGESGELQVRPADCSAAQVAGELVERYSAHPAANGRSLSLDPAGEDAALRTDRTLLMRVLGNMIKNALEAEPAGAAVTLGCRRQSADKVEFWVRNPSVMPEAARRQVFLRSYTTKGEGRGLGTYSMKLLGERYLGGRISFTSAEGEGTVFRFECPSRP